jgi:hypothetical protein
MEMSGQLHAPTASLPRKEPSIPLDGRMGCPDSRSGRDGEVKEVLASAGNRFSSL